MIRAIAALFSTSCPHCRSNRSVGVGNAIERTFHWLLQPYRCTLCGRDFFLFRWQAPGGGAA